ncbi:hypothetical protein Bca4012_017313 [Brassica carinata]
MAYATLSHSLILSSSRFSRLGHSTRFLRQHTNPLPVPRFRCYCSDETSPSVKKRVVSGVQPTGSIHLGNYLGAIKNWVTLQMDFAVKFKALWKIEFIFSGCYNVHILRLSVFICVQDTYETLFFIVDLHAITLPYDVQELRKATRDTAALYLACGVDISKASVFVQSHVRAHVELMWLLSSSTPIGWLQKMTQFKEKSRKEGGENASVSLLTYPVLMAADILLYKSDFVPVGEDQKQHLELARDLAQRVNNLYGGRKWKKLGGRGGSIFKIPEPLIPQVGARVMSLTDGLSKMSKSAPSDQSRINLLDSKDLIADKIKRCKTDSFVGLEFDNAERPECNNLLSVYQIVSGKTKEEVMEECKDMSWGTFKPLLADAVIEHLSPIQVRYQEITAESAYLDKVLSEGADRATEIAESTIHNLKQAMGFYL